VTYFSAFGVTGLGQFRSNVLAKIVTDHIVGEIPAKKKNSVTIQILDVIVT